MQVSVLGTLEVVHDDQPIPIESPKERAVLEVLALHAPEVVPVDALVRALWAEDPPLSAPKSRQSHVSRLRKVLPPDTIATETTGYRLFVKADDLDVSRFERLADVADSPARTGQRVRLEELRAAAIEDRVDAHLQMGSHHEIVPDLEDRVAEHRVLEDDPEPLAPPARPAVTVPAPITSFVGRVTQMRDVLKLLDEHRLVSILGPGGVGRSRLAVEVAHIGASRHRDSTWWVDLGPLERTDDLIAELVKVLRVVVPSGMPGSEALAMFLSSRDLLLVLDNAEHLIDGLGAILTAFLESAPGLSTLVTSRAPLGINGEQRYRLPPLEIDTGDDPDPTVESVRLFLDRWGERVGTAPGPADMEMISTMCRLVDGLPLGIELTAGAAASAGIRRTLGDLEAHRGLLDEPAPNSRIGADHGGLLAALRSTVDMLTSEQFRLLGALTVLRSTFDDAAAEAVGAEQTSTGDLTRLSELGLVTPVDTADGSAPAPSPRYDPCLRRVVC